ncbi:ribosomal protein S5-alanine N-acetyltransferase [Vibrio algivorus]|uniref:ribosomal protein S5-alanine N-acetyltransferase n=1 Tax=Vibrio algivorus TaxID=1667024 RepID=UPI001FD1FF94|nr:ribosomal protein S5-alanine N-acetyltransferase [Vibrio algivorus]
MKMDLSTFELLIGDSFELENANVRLIGSGDEKMMADFYNQNHQHLTPWDPVRGSEFYTIEGWKNRIKRLNDFHQMNTVFSFIIVDKQETKVLGTISFTNVSGFPIHACNLGYSLAETAQGKGIMTQALQVCIPWIFKHQNLHRIMAAYMPENRRSEKLLDNLGFEFEGIAKDYLLINGQWETHRLMSLINSAWRTEA